MKFVDTNVFIRFLTGDDREKAEACWGFFKRLERGDERATTSESVLAEIVYVLSSKGLYALGRPDIEARLRPMLLLRGLQLPHQRRYLRALALYARLTWADFEDAVAIAQMEEDGITTIESYDRGFDRAEGITREEPPAVS